MEVAPVAVAPPGRTVPPLAVGNLKTQPVPPLALLVSKSRPVTILPPLAVGKARRWPVHLRRLHMAQPMQHHRAHLRLVHHLPVRELWLVFCAPLA